MPTSQKDADLMLREARGAIEQGRLVEAEKILTRVESAHINFSVFHVGPTPASVRRELVRAQRLSHADSKSPHRAEPAAGKSHLPFARTAAAKPNPVEDPFAAHNLATGSAAGSPAPSTPGRDASNVSAPKSLSASHNSQPANARVENPYAVMGRNASPAANSSYADQLGSLSGLKYPVTPASAEENPFRGTSAGGPVNAAATEDHNATQNSPRALPAPSQPMNAAPSRAASPKQQVQAELSAARKALQNGDIAQAEKRTQAAISLGVPESEFLPDEDRPSLIAWDITRAKQKGPAAPGAPAAIERLPATTQARNESPARYEASSRYDIQQAQLADPADSPLGRNAGALPTAYNAEVGHVRQSPPTSSSNRLASTPSTANGPASSRIASAAEPPTSHLAGDGPPMLAPPSFGAPQNAPESSLRIASAPLPPASAPPSEDLPLPQSPTATPAAEPAQLPMENAAPAGHGKATLIDTADENQQALAHQLSAEIGKRQTEAQQLLEKDPERALATLHEAQQLVNDSKLPESARRELLSRIDITLKKAEHYTSDHRAEIDLDKQNATVLADHKHDQEMRLKLQQKIAENIDEFNRLKDEQRYAEAEIIARRLNELAPDDPVVAQVWQMAKFLRREMMNRQLADNKEQSVWNQLNAVEQSAINPVAEDGKEMTFDHKYWGEFVKDRKGSKERVQRHTERELEIERRLKTPVLLKYQDTPLTEVMEGLSELTGVNVHLDPRGLTQEGVNSDTPVTINLTKEVQLKSALNLILEPLHLSYVINDEVLKITSEQLRDGEIYPQTYNVADLVTPIPNFVPSSNMGLQGMINESMAAAGRGSRPGFAQNGPSVLVNNRGGSQQVSGGGDNILAQQFNAAPASGLSPSTVPIGAGPGGMGAAANADFDSLIDLIVSTVSTDTWAENGGGTAEIRPFPTNLSLVISQTQAVHEEIADLLQQLRRLQDLQVTIEVRFIRLNDSFFERIGIDFDLNIKDTGVNANNANQFQPNNPNGLSNTVGLQRAAPPIAPFPNFTTDLDIPFRQGNFNVSLPAFGGFDPNSAATFGFAILSDIEAFFLIEAAQGDKRTNVLNAPKVTLFNGQQAFVADATQRPFVVGVIPVVGEFASAQQPVIVVLNEGTMMTIQAVVSDDRRYVRMTIVPFFTQIGNVDTFTFEGSSSTTSSSSSTDNDDDGKNEKKDSSDAATRSGVTVQLPSFSFVSVVTTVSVPDGGTVLLGGIKRLSEGRNEFGVPLLSKVPYINRLFRNVGIGRETDSLMMMVTPRIIIQEEEEERLLGVAAP